MTTLAIKNKELFKIVYESEQKVFYGSNQEWYARRWQRMSGCGPSTATNIIYYINTTCNDEDCSLGLSMKECLELMNEIWNYVTPGIGGVSSTGMFRKGFQKYLLEKNINIKLDSLDIPKKKTSRPDLRQVIEFLRKPLLMDTPIAFLNLENGKISELDSWHWVTIISLEYDLDAEIAYVGILDGGVEKRIDLPRWLHYTRLGGGFVSCERIH